MARFAFFGLASIAFASGGVDFFIFYMCFACITLDSAFFSVYFSVVEYRTRADMERAIKQMSQSCLDGRKIFVKEV